MLISRRTLRLASLPVAAVVGLLVGACSDHGEYRINKVCKDYCERVVDCNDNADFDDCLDGCIDQAESCDSDDDTADALDLLEECTADSCNDVAACTIEAWLECAL